MFILKRFTTRWILVVFLIRGILRIISFLGLSWKERRKITGTLETLRPFECGFNSFQKKYLGFCVQFLNIAILFLLVDLEIALLIPFFFNSFFLEKFFWKTTQIVIFIILFLIVLLAVEYRFGGLNWKEEISRIQLIIKKANKFGAYQFILDGFFFFFPFLEN